MVARLEARGGWVRRWLLVMGMEHTNPPFPYKDPLGVFPWTSYFTMSSLWIQPGLNTVQGGVPGGVKTMYGNCMVPGPHPFRPSPTPPVPTNVIVHHIQQCDVGVRSCKRWAHGPYVWVSLNVCLCFVLAFVWGSMVRRARMAAPTTTKPVDSPMLTGTTAWSRKRVRVLHDTVWGATRLPQWAWRIIDTPEFQRLRDLAQTGFMRLVYPGATHDRFSHSLGTAFLAHELLTGLAQSQPELGITRREMHSVVLGALCHDLGHGPGSHAFDRFMGRVDPSWRHEHQSIHLLHHLIRVRGLQPVLDAEDVDVHLACETILGSAGGAPVGWTWMGPVPGREFLFQVVSNATSGMDVDKWDYLERDGKYANISGSHNVRRLLQNCRVLTDGSGATRITWPVMEASNVNNMFLARYNMHAQAYQHRVVRVLDAMIMEALWLMRDVEVEAGVSLGTAVAHPEVFVKTTDWVVNLALRGIGRGLEVPPEAAAIFSRVLVRDLWKEVAKWTPAPSVDIDKAGLVRDLAHASGVRETSFVLDVSAISCGKGRFDPMAKVPFFEEEDDDRGPVAVDRVHDYMRPMCFQRRVVRVFHRGTPEEIAREGPLLAEALAALCLR